MPLWTGAYAPPLARAAKTVVLLIVACSLAGCSGVSAGRGAPTPAPSANPLADGVAWPPGIGLAAGQRTVLRVGSSAFVATQPFEDSSLSLTMLSTTDGEILDSTLITHDVGPYTGVGLASDGTGSLWIAYGTKIAQLDLSTMALAMWDLPAPPSDVMPSAERPNAGSVVAAAWDEKLGSLVFLRNYDHRLYGWDLRTKTAEPVADLPIVTGPTSGLSVTNDGKVIATGSLIAAHTFTPTAAVVPTLGASPEIVNSARAACIAKLGISLLTSAGTVLRWGQPSEMLAAGVPASAGRPVFACDDDGYVYVTSMGRGSLVVTRLAADGARSDVTLSLVALAGPPPHAGLNPSSSATWADPRIDALLPDGAGGIWVVGESGSQSSSDMSPVYPSLTHLTFPR